MLTKDILVAKLENDDRWLIRALIALNNRQTTDEQREQTTKYTNGMGFRSCDAAIGSSMVAFYRHNGYLTRRQLDYWRKRQKNGVMRIAVYWRQLLEVAQQKNTQ